MRVSRLLTFDMWRENFGVAIDALRASKLRSALTILGVVIGVSTVMTMASIVQGIQQQIVNAIEVAGPTTFYVMRVFSTSPVNPENLPKWIRIRPELSWAEAERIQSLPEIYYAGIWAQVQGRLEYNGERTRPTIVNGADDHFQDIYGGELVAGRWFTKPELRSGAAVVVIDETKALSLFGRLDPLGKTINVGGKPATVIGLYGQPQNIFAPPGADNGAIMPFRYVYSAYYVDKTNALFICVKPKPGVTVADAQEAVNVAMREMRRLRPADPNTFDMITQDQVLDIFNSITGTFFMVMIVLASVALMVGGIGVMAIMMVSVTARTREIGVRKAMGATRRDILLQFLIEAATLTGIGGVIGIAFGLLAGKGVTMLMSIQADPPLALTAVAVLVSVGIGVIFGVVPAQRAARLDPVDALRYE
jgi:putative ABC transport system permease protein